MSELNASLFLDALCLKTYSSSEYTNALLRALTTVVKEDDPTNPIIVDPFVKLYAAILDEILQYEIDLSIDKERAVLLLKFKDSPVVIQEPEIFSDLEVILKRDQEVPNQRIVALQQRIKNSITYANQDKFVRRLSAKNYNYSSCTDDHHKDTLLNEMLGHAREIVESHGTLGDKHSDTIEEIDLTDKESIKEALNSNKLRKKSNVFRTGLQGLNKMFGSNGGPTLGEFVAFAALSANYKSGIMMDMARWIAIHNKPKLSTTETPLILVISLENEATENLLIWYRMAYANMFKRLPDDLSDDEVINFIVEEFNKNGFHLKVVRRLPTTFGYHEFVTMIQQYKAKGYRVMSCIIDYLALMKRLEGFGNDASALQKTTECTKNFAKHEGFSLITGFQLDGGAGIIADSGNNYIVKRLGRSHLKDCKGLFQEADWLTYMHIETNSLSGIKYLTFHLKKHRYVTDHAPEDFFTAYPFGPFGIMDDIDGECQEVKDIYTVDDMTNNNATNAGLF